MLFKILRKHLLFTLIGLLFAIVSVFELVGATTSPPRDFHPGAPRYEVYLEGIASSCSETSQNPTKTSLGIGVLALSIIAVITFFSVLFFVAGGFLLWLALLFCIVISYLIYEPEFNVFGL